MLVFLFNPFGAPVLKAVVDNMQRQRSTGFILYLSPAHDDILRGKSFTLFASGEFYFLWKV